MTRSKNIQIPYLDHDFNDLDKFAAWLTEIGADVLDPTNQYEVLRVRGDVKNCGTTTHVLYRKSSGKLTWPVILKDAYKAFRNGKKKL